MIVVIEHNTPIVAHINIKNLSYSGRVGGFVDRSELESTRERAPEIKRVGTVKLVDNQVVSASPILAPRAANETFTQKQTIFSFIPSTLSNHKFQFTT